jgi:hypothetical protein
MIVYHGSTVVVKEPKIITSEFGRDFGAGFYTTDIRGQAERWALRKARIERRKVPGSVAYLSIFEFDEDCYHVLSAKHFPEPTEEWLDLVCKCRSNAEYHHGYDIVTGKIANDNVGETVSYVMQGIMRREDAIARLKFEQINNQICFNTEKALDYLRYVANEECR